MTRGKPATPKRREAQEASDRFTERERPCARCGNRFTTTPAQSKAQSRHSTIWRWNWRGT